MKPSETNFEQRECIVLVANSTWNVYNFRLPVVRALVARGYRVVVVAPIDAFVSQLAGEACVTLTPLRHLRRTGTGLWRNLLLLLELTRIYRRLRPALVLHFTIKPNILGNLAARLLRLPSVCVVTGLGYTFLHRGWLQGITRALYHLSFRSAKKVVFENADDRDWFVQKRIVRPQQSLVVKGCGVDVQHFSPNGWHGGPDKTVFVFIGRLLADKGIREFVEAARQLKPRFPHAEFWVLGNLDDDNPAHVDKAELLDWVQRDVVKYKGATHDVRPFLAQADWVVLPSYREGLSRVLLEAMAMAKPVVTTDAAGCRDAVEPGKTGFLVPVKNVQALTDTLARCCSLDAEQVREMGRLGREKAVLEFESAQVGLQYQRLVAEILGKPE